MSEILGQTWIFMVAQKPFEARSQAGTHTNTFCTLRPVCSVDGAQLARDGDFPNRGLVFWLVDPAVAQLAQPGRLITGRVEWATREFEDKNPESDMYQIDPDHVDQLSTEEAYEVFTVSDPKIKSPADLVDVGVLVRANRPVARMAYVRWNGSLYGSFSTTDETPDGFAPQKHEVRLEPPRDYVVHRISEQKRATLPQPTLLTFSPSISLDRTSPFRSRSPVAMPVEVLTAAAHNNILRVAEEHLSIKPARVILAELAKELLARHDRQTFIGLLKSMEAKASASAGVSGAEASKIIQTLRESEELKNAEAQRLANAIVESGVIGQQVEAGMQAQISELIKQRSFELNAEIEERVKKVRKELEGLSKERSRLASENETRRRDAGAAIERELRKLREANEADLGRRRKEVEARELQLEQSQAKILRTLEATVSKYRDGSGDLITQFLGFLPMLREVGFAAGGGAQTAPAPLAEQVRPRREHSLPKFVTAARSNARIYAKESDFLKRVEQFSRQVGFEFRSNDLVSFHVSLKCGGLTVLGGASGTGKTSLCRLYSRVLCGGTQDQAGRALTIHVNPSWLDANDVMGHVNAIERTFQPSETGLFELLIAAAEEEGKQGTQSGMFLVTLDELNLAQPEHYFSSFLQLIGSPVGERDLRVFSKGAVSDEDPFAPWATVALAPTVLFTGTVNFDETTKPLSLRFLDRANVIRIRPAEIQAVTAAATEKEASATFAALSHDEWSSWIKPEKPPPDTFAQIAQKLDRPLQTLGCPLTPRRMRAIRLFFANAEGLVPQDTVTDLQIVQRVIPQIRGLLRREARAAVDEIRNILESSPIDLRESRTALEELTRTEFGEGLVADE